MAGGGVQGFVMDQSVNLAIAICIGLAVGFFEDVPINLVPDALIFGLTIAMISQEVALRGIKVGLIESQELQTS